jgi:hypothetical protein
LSTTRQTWSASVTLFDFGQIQSRREAARSANIERASQFDISKNVAQTIEILMHLSG